MSNNANEDYDDFEFPFMSFMISNHPDPLEQIPVMALFLNYDEIIEMDMDMLERAINPETNKEGYKPRIVAKISDVNKRDALARVRPGEGVITFFVGEENKPVVDKNSIESEHSIGLIDASISINDYTLRVEQWMSETLSEIDNQKKQ